MIVVEVDMKSNKIKFLTVCLISVLIIALGVGIYMLSRYQHTSAKKLDDKYRRTVTKYISSSDKDGDKIDDQSDILMGALAYVETRPKYKSKYYEGGYPTDEYGVCTDVVARGFLAAGYDLQKLVDEDETLRKTEIELQNRSNRLKRDIDVYKHRLDEDISKYEYLKQQREKQKAKYNGIIEAFESDKGVFDRALDFEKDYDSLQMSNPWFDEKYRIEQSKLFVLALQVRKEFLYENRKNLKAAINIWKYQKNSVEKNKKLINIAWNWINLCIPVISSTFASFSRMLKNIDENVLGHTFVDEAGQALPQAAVGAVFRSKNIMVVGDPFQIKPVLTLDEGILALLSKIYNVSEIYLSESACVQTLVDAVSKYGFYTSKDMDENSWIGIPLWVHRRCQYPMFTISNAVSYNNLMVQGKEGYGKTGWYDISGKAANKYVEEQGDFLLKKIKSMIEKDPKIIDKNESDTVYIISPFKNVAYKLGIKLNEIGFTRKEKGKVTNIGTIHTFQGKEAPIVFMVLGADTNSKGAATWAVNEANMMNVAATRAKKEFYIIGDRKLYSGLGSDVITKVNNVIKEYGNEHPELVDEITD